MSQVDAAALRARNILIAAFVVFVALDALLVTIAADLWAIGRILFTLVVMGFVLRGRRWAKWLLIVICGLLAVSLVALLALLWTELSPILQGGSGVMILYCLAIPYYLVTNRDLNRFFAQQRQRRQSN